MSLKISWIFSETKYLNFSFRHGKIPKGTYKPTRAGALLRSSFLSVCRHLEFLQKTASSCGRHWQQSTPAFSDSTHCCSDTCFWKHFDLLTLQQPHIKTNRRITCTSKPSLLSQVSYSHSKASAGFLFFPHVLSSCWEFRTGKSI